MNEHADTSELPELTDEDVEILYAICKRADDAPGPPFKTLFAAYDKVFAEQQIHQQHDGVIFRYLMRVGESTRATSHRDVDLIEQLRTILEAQGITFLAPSEDGTEDATQSIKPANAGKSVHLQSPRRRSSFDDARLDETWLSEHSQPINSRSPAAQSGLLSLPPKRGRELASTRRTRSTSDQRALPMRIAEPEIFQRGPTESAYEAKDQFHPILYLEPSQTQLEQNAEAFLSTSAYRYTRQLLRVWRDVAVQTQQTHLSAFSIAVAHDRHTLLSQALDQWRSALDIRREEDGRLKRLQQLEERASRYRNLYLLTKAFTHWATSSSIERIRTAVAQRHVLKTTYFRKWRAIASHSQLRMRKILGKKYLAIWREKTARRLLWQEEATAYYEETLMRRCKTRWFWNFCSRRVEIWHDQNIQKRALICLESCLDANRAREEQANDFDASRVAKRAMRAIPERLEQQRRRNADCEQHVWRIVTSKALQQMQTQVKLAPVARALTLRVQLNLKSKVLKVWHLHLSLLRRAAEVDRRRILQTAWTKWNDALRCKALAQKIDERVLVENLYRWVLQERLELFLRMADAATLRRALAWWANRVQQDRDMLGEAATVFVERQRRRRLTLGMLRLNIAARKHEDAERAAIEAANARTMPKILNAFKEKAQHVGRLAKWSNDARFYFLCTSTLRMWRQKTNDAKQTRRRNAYAHIRARVKVRLAESCLTRWRAKTQDVRSNDAEAGQLAQNKTAMVGRGAFYRWREKTAQYNELHVHATSIDQQKLLRSALTAMSHGQADLAALHQEALNFRHDTDLALMMGALKRIQWATFTVARKIESADALCARYRDQHIKHMLRHWAGQVAGRRVAGVNATATRQEEQDSPSLRPASRAISHSALPSSPPEGLALHSTPGYLRTPSRSRRAGRFRPLPAVEPFTPMTIDVSHFVTMPATLYGTAQVGVDESMIERSPEVTPFERKLRAGGFAPAGPSSAFRSALPPSSANRAIGTGKSVRFAGSSRFRRKSNDDHEKTS